MTKTHGQSAGNGTREYRAWLAMIGRCEYPKHVVYKYYGGRGVPFHFKQWGEWAIDTSGGVMPESGERKTWIGKNGRTFNPSAPFDQDCWAMMRVGKKAAGRLLDGQEHNEFPAANAA